MSGARIPWDIREENVMDKDFNRYFWSNFILFRVWKFRFIEMDDHHVWKHFKVTYVQEMK